MYAYLLLKGKDKVLTPSTKEFQYLPTRSRGLLYLAHSLDPVVINLPQRNKQCLVTPDDPAFINFIKNLDLGSATYKEKLASFVRDSDFVGTVNNITTTTHGTFALLANNIQVSGLYDMNTSSSYLLFGTDITKFPIADNFLIYPLGVLNNSIFLHIEALCSKWEKWDSRYGTLFAFNALQRKLHGQARLCY